MKKRQAVQLRSGSREEIMPDFSPDFPYIASYVEMDRLTGNFVPWHWHKEIELFYILEGNLEYDTPKGKTLFGPGSAGIVNSNVLHRTSMGREGKKTAAYIHLFDPVFISGSRGSRIDRKYVTPFVTAAQLEIVGLYPQQEESRALLEAVRQSFEIDETKPAYELKLRNSLSEIWVQMFSAVKLLLKEKGISGKTDEKAKRMLAFIHENYGGKITVSEIAGAAFISERECFRTFHECLHMTPAEYLTDCRLQAACRMLVNGNDSITRISQTCGFSSSSYFGKIFRSALGCTPLEYRRRGRKDG